MTLAWRSITALLSPVGGVEQRWLSAASVREGVPDRDQTIALGVVDGHLSELVEQRHDDLGRRDMRAPDPSAT
jgi:hypothetical protein